MHVRLVTLKNTTLEVLTEGDRYLGIGRCSIAGTVVRSGRLPILPHTNSFCGCELDHLTLAGIRETPDEIRITLGAHFRAMETKPMRDHSFDPIHETGDWGASAKAPAAERLDLVVRPATDSINGVALAGFRYHYEYDGARIPLYFLLDRASWELDGQAEGVTAVSQSSCSAPVATFSKDNAWSTEGMMHWAKDDGLTNLVMTHNLPRWASHQAFDFQYKGDKTLVGIFQEVGLIRSIVAREAGAAEIKVFDKHIFDQGLKVATTPKAILLNSEPKSAIDQQNLWTWTIQEVHARARAEFGLKEEPLYPRISVNFWKNFTFDSYRKDLLPAAKSIGVRQIFIDNVNRSAMTEQSPHKDWGWNMCCGHEYEIAPKLGGYEMAKAFIDDCKAAGIRPYAWTNNTQALSSPLNKNERHHDGSWYVMLEDTRQKYGGAYAGCMSVWSFNRESARANWRDSLLRNKEMAGLDAYLFDSFYNLGFMPIDYSNRSPKTMWRNLLKTMKELQDAGINFLIESFGAFGQPQHGCPTSYNVDNLFACYKVGLGTNYTTIPSGATERPKGEGDAEVLYRVLAHMTDPQLQLFSKGARIDTTWKDEHRRALADYNRNQEQMHRRYLQQDEQGVVWHNQAGDRATVWNFKPRKVRLPGKVFDLTAERELPRADVYHLEACHTYAVTETADLPRSLAAAE